MSKDMDDAIQARLKEIRARSATEMESRIGARNEFAARIAEIDTLVQGFIAAVRRHGVEPAPIEVCPAVVEIRGVSDPTHYNYSPYILEAISSSPLLGWRCFRYHYENTMGGESLGWSLSALATTDGRLLSVCYDKTPSGALPWHASSDKPAYTNGLSMLQANPIVTDAALYIDGVANCIEQGRAEWLGDGVVRGT